jgi:ASC-1-like (ASCH) protein
MENQPEHVIDQQLAKIKARLQGLTIMRVIFHGDAVLLDGDTFTIRSADARKFEQFASAVDKPLHTQVMTSDRSFYIVTTDHYQVYSDWITGTKETAVNDEA